jgi:hypothetical protein
MVGRGVSPRAAAGASCRGLYSFGPGDGAQPISGLLSEDGNLYGMCGSGGAFGAGTVFRVKK